MVAKDSNIVLVVDDDQGMLKAVQRLLRLHAYEPIIFSSVEAFKNYPDVEEAACVILDINLKDKLDSVRARVGRLTPREREVFEQVVRGEPNKQIARAIGCTARTVKAHRHNVMEKMQVKSLAELVSIAERIGVASSTRQMD